MDNPVSIPTYTTGVLLTAMKRGLEDFKDHHIKSEILMGEKQSMPAFIGVRTAREGDRINMEVYFSSASTKEPHEGWGGCHTRHVKGHYQKDGLAAQLLIRIAEKAGLREIPIVHNIPGTVIKKAGDYALMSRTETPPAKPAAGHDEARTDQASASAYPDPSMHIIRLQFHEDDVPRVEKALTALIKNASEEWKTEKLAAQDTAKRGIAGKIASILDRPVPSSKLHQQRNAKKDGGFDYPTF